MALAVAAAVASERLLPAALLAAALFWPLRWLATGRPTVRTPGDWAIGLLALMLPVTLWATALPEVTRPAVLQLLMGIAFYFALVNWGATAGRLRWLVTGFVLAGLALAVLAPFLGGLPSTGKLSFIPLLAARVPKVFAEAVNPNVVAGALAVLSPLTLGLLAFWPRGRRFEGLVIGAAGLAMLGVLILTQSRGAWMGVAAAALALIALRWRRGWVTWPLGAVAAGLLAWRIGFGRAVEAILAGQAAGGAEQRLEIWSRAVYMLQDFPFTGIGMGTFRQVANLLYPFFLAGPDAEIPHAHNLLLQIGVDLGLPGLIAWLAIFLLVCWSAWRVYRRGRTSSAPPLPRSPAPPLSALGAGLLASQVALIVHGLTDAATWGTRPAVLVWAIWGLAMAALNLTQE